MTIARQFYVLVCLPPLLAIAFGAGLTYRFADLSAQGSHLVSNLQRTQRISQELAKGNAEASRLLSAQLELPDPAFPDRLRDIDYELAERSTEYLRLDIGVQERLAVERIKGLLSELTVVGLQVHRHLLAGADRAAATDLNRAHRIEGEVGNEFQKLSGLQLATLRAVLAHGDFVARQGLYALASLVAALFLAAAATTVVTRRRIIQPIRSVLEASERIRVGDLAARAPEGRDDEIGRLTHGFNFMAESLARSYGDLERKVADRTARLEEVQGQLVQAEKLSAIGQLVGGVAHELNNPLAAIMGFTELAKVEAAARPEAAPILRLLEQLDAHVERSRRIVGNLLQFARREEPHVERSRRIVGNLLHFARRQEPHVEAFEINAAVEQMIELRAYQLVTRNTQIVRAYDPSNPVLCADRDKLQQVVLNLLNNAHDAIAETGRPGTVTVTTRAENGSIVVQLADDGPGFRDPGRAFDPFYTTKEVGKGTGLGLSVCYGIVKEHGGEITAANLERGAVVTVRLPAGDPSAVAAARDGGRAAQEPGSSPPAARHTVLVVDDEPALVRLQLTFLARMGLEGHGVESGEEAIRYLEEHQVDAVVSDVRMPGSVDGIKIYEWVAANRPAIASRFLFVSGDLLGLNLDAFFERNRVLRVSKPFRYEAYSRAVLEAVSEAGRDTAPETVPEGGSRT